MTSLGFAKRLSHGSAHSRFATFARFREEENLVQSREAECALRPVGSPGGCQQPALPQTTIGALKGGSLTTSSPNSLLSRLELASSQW